VKIKQLGEIFWKNFSRGLGIFNCLEDSAGLIMFITVQEIMMLINPFWRVIILSFLEGMIVISKLSSVTLDFVL
jgi:hypothetical protein